MLFALVRKHHLFIFVRNWNWFCGNFSIQSLIFRNSYFDMQNNWLLRLSPILVMSDHDSCWLVYFIVSLLFAWCFILTKCAVTTPHSFSGFALCACDHWSKQSEMRSNNERFYLPVSSPTVFNYPSSCCVFVANTLLNSINPPKSRTLWN